MSRARNDLRTKRRRRKRQEAWGNRRACVRRFAEIEREVVRASVPGFALVARYRLYRAELDAIFGFAETDVLLPL